MPIKSVSLATASDTVYTGADYYLLKSQDEFHTLVVTNKGRRIGVYSPLMARRVAE